MNRVIVLSLIISFSSLIGCSYYVVSEEDFIYQEEKKDIKILTADLNEYYFDDDNYFIENDTLKGIIEVKTDDNNYVYKDMQIPLNEIKVHLIKQTSYALKTCWIAGMATFLVALLLGTLIFN